MTATKIIPCLDMKDGRVVKGVHFINLRDAGNPVENASFYQEEGADELAMLDIAATVEGRKTRLSWVEQVSNVIDIPLVVGGGISTLDDMEALFGKGANKISINSAAVGRPQLVKEASDRFGKEKVIVAIDGRRNEKMPSGFEVVVSGGQKPVGKDAVEWAKQCEALGVGRFYLRAWMGMEPLPDMIFRLPRQLPRRYQFQLSPQGVPGHLSTFTKVLSMVKPKLFLLPRSFISGRLLLVR